MTIDGSSILSSLCTATTTLVLWRMRLDAQATKRRERAAAEVNAACEARFAALSAEIKKVRDDNTTELLRSAREQTVAMADATIAKRENTRVLDRVCRRLDALPCVRERGDSASLQDITPPPIRVADGQ